MAADHSRRNSLLLASTILTLLAGVFLRAWRLGAQLLLDDEWHALNAVQEHGYRWIFSHLGHADHSIPLTLLYEFFSHTIGLSEWTMRLPSLLAGIALLVLLPWLLRHWLRPGERLMLTALLAISPMLINYSRIARPYALLALLGSAALPLAWRWWQRYRPVPNAWAWFTCTIAAGWLNPVTLATTTGPYLWFLPSAVRRAFGDRQYGPLLRTCGMSIMMASVLVLLLFVPLSVDWASLAIKSGVHETHGQTWMVALSLFSGTGSMPLSLVTLALAMTGWFELQSRDADFARFMLLVAAAASAAVALTGAEWIGFGIVLARYLVGLLPLFLALVSLGLLRIVGMISPNRLPAAAVAALACAILTGLLVLRGPLPSLDFRYGQFLQHMSWQFDYNEARNPIRAALAGVRPEGFYREIAEAHPDGGAVVVEAPWWLESNWNALPLYQQVHGQQVKVGFVGGLCAGKLYGEIDPAVSGMAFRNFVSLADLASGRETADYVVFRSRGLPGARAIEMDADACISALRKAWGDPWRRRDGTWVFRPGRAP